MATQKKKTPKKVLNTKDLFALDIPIANTGVIAFDLVLTEEGYAQGDVIEFSSESGLGKSSSFLTLIKNFLSQGKKVLVLDAERGMKRKTFKDLGVEVEPSYTLGDDFVVLAPTTYQEAKDVMNELIVKNITYDVLLIDSITELKPDISIDMEYEERLKHIGLKARWESLFMSDLKVFARQQGTTIFFISQTRTKFNSFVTYTDSAGSNALQFGPDVRLFMRKVKSIVATEYTIEGEKEVEIGVFCYIFAKKNRNQRSFINVPLHILFGKGVSNILTLQYILSCNGLLRINGARNALFPDSEDEIVFQGKKKCYQHFKENYEDLYAIAKSRGLLKLLKTNTDVADIP